MTEIKRVVEIIDIGDTPTKSTGTRHGTSWLIQAGYRCEDGSQYPVTLRFRLRRDAESFLTNECGQAPRWLTEVEIDRGDVVCVTEHIGAATVAS